MTSIKKIVDLMDDKKLIIIIGQDEALKTKIIKAVSKGISKRIKKYSEKDVYNKSELLVNPENGLHPHEQCKKIEQIAINCLGAPYVVFTNSPFIVDHLNNLMKAATFKPKVMAKIKDKFILKSVSAFVPRRDVAAFDCEDGKIKNILTKKDEDLINWDTFSKVSEWACDLYFNMDDDKHESRKTQ